MAETVYAGVDVLKWHRLDIQGFGGFVVEASNPEMAWLKTQLYCNNMPRLGFNPEAHFESFLQSRVMNGDARHLELTPTQGPVRMVEFIGSQGFDVTMETNTREETHPSLF